MMLSACVRICFLFFSPVASSTPRCIYIISVFGPSVPGPAINHNLLSVYIAVGLGGRRRCRAPCSSPSPPPTPLPLSLRSLSEIPQLNQTLSLCLRQTLVGKILGPSSRSCLSNFMCENARPVALSGHIPKTVSNSRWSYFLKYIYIYCVANFAFASVGPACRHPLPRHQLGHLSCGRMAFGASSSELGRRPSARTYVQLKTKTKQICQIEAEGGLGPQFPEG